MVGALRAEKPPAVERQPPPAAKLKPKILIVDDRKENLLATEKVLRPLGADIFRALSGNEALTLILHHQFAVVLLDVQMPEMDGFETAMLMQEHESMQGVPIIFVTAISKEDRYATQAAEIGAVDYIFKPINPDILKSKIKVYLDLYILNSILRQSNEELERFAYICSHDLQEPVRVMNRYAEFLAEDYETILDEQGHKYIDLIIKNANRMQKMIQDILSFSKVGREEIIIEKVDCNAVVREVLAEFEPQIVGKGARMVCGPLPVLDSNATLMRVLFQNLIGNALKFQDGTRVPEVHIAAEAQDGAWRFSVRDNGIGIDPAFESKIFTIFQRFHRKEDYPGTGLGLSTCRKLIQLWGGDIGFESSPGQGTLFFFAFPRGGA